MQLNSTLLSEFSDESHHLWELKALIISCCHNDVKYVCGHSRRRSGESENIFNNLPRLMRLSEALTQQ